MRTKMLAIVGVVGGIFIGSNNAEAGDGCRGYSSSIRYSYPVVVSKPVVVSSPVVVSPTVVVVAKEVAPQPEVSIPQGSTLRLKVNFLGTQPGLVVFTSGNITLNCEIVEWNPNFVIIRMPNAGFLAATQGRLTVSNSEGIVKRKVEVMVQPTPDVEVVETGAFIQRAPREIFSQGSLNTGGLDVTK